LYDNTSVSIKDLPYNNSIISFINANRKNYTHVILISGSYYKYVESIANYLNIFDSYKGTSTTTNMISSNKTTFLKNNFNNFVFDYIGDSKKDIPIWEKSRKAFVVDRKNITKYLKNINYEIIPFND
jgi:predicted mannosyl-3-phosphoglycerate phosphatase (HAD superfamily)